MKYNKNGEKFKEKFYDIFTRNKLKSAERLTAFFIITAIVLMLQVIEP